MSTIWTTDYSLRDMAAIVSYLRHDQWYLPGPLADIVAGYVDATAKLQTLTQARGLLSVRAMRVRLETCIDCDARGMMTRPECVTIFFTDPMFGGQSRCSHVVAITDAALWEFACGDRSPAIEQVIEQHTDELADVFHAITGIRNKLRRELMAEADVVGRA